MKIWLLQSSEPMPVVNSDIRLFRTGMLAEELSKSGHDVLWFANSFEHYTKKQMFNNDTMIVITDNYKLFLPYGRAYKKNISFSRIINHWMITRKFKKQSKLTDKPDLIYASFPIIGYAYEAVKYGVKNNVPVVVDIRDLWPDIFNHNLPKLLSLIGSPYIRHMDRKTKYILKNCYAINGTSEEMVQWGLNKAGREKNKYDRSFYIGYEKCSGKGTIANDKIIDKKKFNISFFATINNQFNYNLIYEIALELNKRDKNIVINICGDGPKLNLVKEEMAKLENVKILGWLSMDKLQKVLSNSDLGLAPYNNTFDFQMSVSNKFAEYLSYGLPIVITCLGNMKSILEEYNCGFGSLDVNMICDYILEIKSNKKEYKRESLNAKALFESKFVASKIYKAMVDYIEEVGDEFK